jgi:hypothetical protein
VVVVDVDHERSPLEERRIRPEAALVRGVHGKEDALVGIRGRLAEQAAELHEEVLTR